MPETTLTSEEKQACREQAGEHLIAVLKGERTPYDVEPNGLSHLLSDLVRTRDNIEHEAKTIREDLDRSLPYVRGEAASFNSLGLLQSSGVRIDQYAMLFAAQVEYAKLALIDYYQAQAEAGFDDEVEEARRPVVEDAKTCRCGMWPVEEYGETCPSCPPSGEKRVYLDARFDVTDLDADERAALAGEVYAQAEESRPSGEDESGHPTVEVEIETNEVEL